MQVTQNRWYAVLSSVELPANKPVGRRRFGVDLAIWRAQGRVAVTADRCPHRRARLSIGRVKDGCVECPFHGFTFDADGACRSIPAHPTRPIPRAMSLSMMTAREEHGYVWLWTGPDPAPAGPIPFFDLQGFRYEGSEFTEEVGVNYTLAIENQLDFAHLPFVHETTIGRFIGEGPFEVETVVDGDRIRARAGGASAWLELIGPNVWRLDLGRSYQVLAFVPIDEDRMVYYVRTYQRAVTVPGLAWVYGRLNRFFNRFILRQDTRVVESIPNGETRLRGMGEVLVPSDGPIIAYRRWRERHRGRLTLAPAESPTLVNASQLVRSAGPTTRANTERRRRAS